MARPKSKAPARRYHISGQSVVTIGGRDIYLGSHDSPASIAKYAVLIGIYQAHSLTLPDDFDPACLDERAATLLGGDIALMAASNQSNTPLLVRHITEEWKRHVTVKYKNAAQERSRGTKIADDIAATYGNVLADEFGPRRLAEWRESLILTKKQSRRYINRLVNNVVKMFRHGVAMELVDMSTLHKLETLEPLRAGQSEAKELPKVVPVDIAHVRATAVFISPIIKSMLRIQLATGMRPNEICRMRPCDIKRDGETWIYRPYDHKTSWRGKGKSVPLVGDARDAIEDYLQRDQEAYCFSPIEAMAWRHAVAASARVTPLNQGNRVGTNRKKTPQRKPRNQYDSQSYRQALQRAADKAGVPRWKPYQCRHLTATAVREALGIEAAQALLGHSHAAMTAHYAEVAESRAIEAARVAPTL